MQESEAKVFFCQNFMINFEAFLSKIQTIRPEIWSERKNDIMDFFESKIQETMQYYLTKYPQKKKVFIESSIKNKIRSFNYSGVTSFNMLGNLKCFFNY